MCVCIGGEGGGGSQTRKNKVQKKSKIIDRQRQGKVEKKSGTRNIIMWDHIEKISRRKKDLSGCFKLEFHLEPWLRCSRYALSGS